MNRFYPHTYPLILTDSIFTAYGGRIGDSIATQRTSAYIIAEMQMTEYIDTFLLPTVVTGTYEFPPRQNFVRLDYGSVQRVFNTTLLDRTSLYTCDLNESIVCVNVWDDSYGYIDVAMLDSNFGSTYGFPYQVRVAYEVGLPTGTANQPPMLQGLVMAAQIALNNIIDPGANESDVGITDFSNQGYSEKRKALKNTAFGSTPRANYIATITNRYKRRPTLRFR